MSHSAHLEELQKKHGELERELADARKHPSVTETDLYRLKRDKLRIKDKIQRLSAQLR